ncbi:MAG TPA: ABC transporter permease subunit [Pyrinomonadaceae bacterium]|jgi:ABC-2 type transport system permease protein|nr:ABC transporter permease subunit [Pyrinomonadaceae bacterium]
MLWYKAWLETRWRFFVGLFVLAFFSASGVFAQPLTDNLHVNIPNLGGRFDEMIREALSLMGSYPGYVWSQWFGKNLLQFWTMFAVLLGVGGIANEAHRGTALWTLSLPVTRRKLLGVRAGVGALELLALAVIPSLLIPALSPLIGKTYSLGDTLAYSLMTFVGGMFFYGLTFLLSTVFADQLKPIITGMSVAFIMGVLSLFSKSAAGYSVYNVMSGQKYFFEGVPPWMGLAACASAAAAMFALSLRVLERRDF